MIFPEILWDDKLAIGIHGRLSLYLSPLPRSWVLDQCLNLASTPSIHVSGGSSGISYIHDQPHAAHYPTASLLTLGWVVRGLSMGEKPLN